MVELVEEMLTTVVAKLTMLMETTKIVTLMEPVPTVPIMLAAKLVMVVVSPINLDVTLLTMYASLAHPMPTVLLTKPTVKMMVLAVIAEKKPVSLVCVPMMVPLVLLPTGTVIL